ncbi:phage gp6-like head-tail connector protein [Klebsiella pneumoniae subsp. pneumoniae]|nr:phage gp6-like head-tail connector protein [Klebsiella pneumoniae subsp. pneumoniae]
MTVINTETAMEHLRLDDEIDKMMVEGYLAAAEDAAMQFLNRRFFADQAALDSAVENESAGDRPSLSSRPPFRARFFLSWAGCMKTAGMI